MSQVTIDDVKAETHSVEKKIQVLTLRRRP